MAVTFSVVGCRFSTSFAASGDSKLFGRRIAAQPPTPHFRLPLRSPSPAWSVRAEASPDAAPVVEQAAGKRPLRGITKPRPVSPAMQALVGVPEIPRTQALKLIWAYIKERNLQDPEDKKIIICDEKLKNLFGGRERVGFLEISGLLNPHFAK